MHPPANHAARTLAARPRQDHPHQRSTAVHELSSPRSEDTPNSSSHANNRTRTINPSPHVAQQRTAAADDFTTNTAAARPNRRRHVVNFASRPRLANKCFRHFLAR
jgi:hypothetical protein